MRLARLLTAYTRPELPGWGRLMIAARVIGDGVEDRWIGSGAVTIRGKRHRYLMRLELSDWAQRMTYFLGRYYEFGVQRVLDETLRPGSRFVDIGGNIGMITLHARSLVGPAGRIDCFEPIPDCVEKIREHLQINKIENVTLHACALSDAPGVATIHIPLGHTGTASLVDLGDCKQRSVSVEVRVGDEVLGAGPVDFIKIDVEGYELRVLKGLSRTLRESKPHVITELIERQLARAGTSAAEVSGVLFDAGYEAYGIGIRRKGLRHELALTPIMRGESFAGFSDVFWMHPSRGVSLDRFISTTQRVRS